MVTFALSTSLRAGNITALCWAKVDMEGKQVWVCIPTKPRCEVRHGLSLIAVEENLH